MTDRTIAYMPLDELLPAPRNPKNATCMACGRSFEVGYSFSQHVVESHPQWFLPVVIEAYTSYLNPDGCWEWLGTRSRQGYALIMLRRRQLKVSRLLLADLADNQDACHRCDNPPCVRPDHLFAGSKAENQRDKAQKGRSARGEANMGGQKLTERDIPAIRSLLALGRTMTSIGQQFGVSRQEISYIARGRHWSHVA